jgi:hypothetical protein
MLKVWTKTAPVFMCETHLVRNNIQWEFPECCFVTVSLGSLLLACRVLVLKSGAVGFKVSRVWE